MVTVEILKKDNPVFDETHRVSQCDADQANRFIEEIKKSRTDDQVQTGDIVELTTSHGDYYESAHVERCNEEADMRSVCAAGIPFIFIKPEFDGKK